MRYWLSNNDGKTVGPHTLDEIRALAASGSLAAAAQVCAENSTDWMPAAAVLSGSPPTSPPFRVAPAGCCCLCGHESNRPATKTLYDHPVCRKCYWGFANRRQASFLIDYLGYYVVNFIVAAMTGAVLGAMGASMESIFWIATLIGWGLLLVFFMKDGLPMNTPGRMLCDVQVVNRFTGTPVGFAASFRRNLPILIPFMVIFIGFQQGRGHRIGDGWSQSKVIWKKYAGHPAFGTESADRPS